MSAVSELSLERRPDGVAVIRLDRPKLNPLSQALLAELAEALAGLTCPGQWSCGAGSGVSQRVLM